MNRTLALAGSALLLASCSGPDLVTTYEGDQATVHRIALPESDNGLITNSYLVEGPRGRVLVDTGTDFATVTLDRALEQLDLAPGDLDLVVVTHGHPDHAGGAAHLQSAWDASIATHPGDLGAVESGEGSPVKVQTPEGWAVLQMISQDPFPPAEVNFVADRSTDLAPYGVGGTLIPTPGHTPGSVSVLLDGGEAFVGDMFRTAEGPDDNEVLTHVFGEDVLADKANALSLLEKGATRFFPGHGGPASAEGARRWTDSPERRAP